ncbi:NAD(P)/FAD-dependent oxidoreductase [Streptomyces sp. NPDC088745]|uniref:NAD(P)/FAD-dependent oxidoreductase n=1 Tax=Streptomyces sp. NPDC088745 TaxID=3365884 RepID=UPI00382CC24F
MTAAPRRVAVVGAGMAAARLAQQTLAQAPPGTLELTLYGHEPHAPYNRALLAGVLDGRYPPGALTLPTGGATVRTGTEIVAVDPASHTLRTASGETCAYDTLVLATGANPVLPPLRNLHATPTPDHPHAAPPQPRTPDLKAGVHPFRTLSDCTRLAEATGAGTANPPHPVGRQAAPRTIVIGGGILGVSAARALTALGLPTELVHQAPHLMERHLDAEAAATVRHALETMGATVYTDNRARALRGTTSVTGVELANGHVLTCDLVVLACGVRPRTGLARAAGIEVRRGIVVDDTLATSAPDVYAIGDCTEHRGAVHGVTGPAWAQADVLAARLSGADPHAVHTGAHASARLTAGALEIAAFGEVTDTAGDALRLADGTRGRYGSYKKLVMRGDRLVGAILVGDLAAIGELTRTYERGEPLPPRPLDLLAALPALPEGAAL